MYFSQVYTFRTSNSWSSTFHVINSLSQLSFLKTVYFPDWEIALSQTMQRDNTISAFKFSFTTWFAHLSVWDCCVRETGTFLCIALCWQERIQGNRSTWKIQGDPVKRNWALSLCVWIAGSQDDKTPHRPPQSNRIKSKRLKEPTLGKTTVLVIKYIFLHRKKWHFSMHFGPYDFAFNALLPLSA